MKNNNNDLFDFLLTTSKNLTDEYYRIQKRATEDPGTAGDQGEENWATVLRDWLPPTLQIVTKGRILGASGEASPQIDILVLQPEYPKQLLDKKLYLAGGVLAAFECKNTLKAEHIKKSLENAVKIRELLPIREGSPYKELHSHIIYGLLAHSHSWKGKASTPLDNIYNNLNENDSQIVQHPREMLDLVCVADLATWTATKMTFIGPRQIPDWANLEKVYGKDGSATTAYIQAAHETENQEENFTPIGAALFCIVNKLAWENIGMRRLSEYYNKVNLGGAGEGSMRIWDASIYSEKIKQRVVEGGISNGAAWDEWGVTFR